MAIRREGLTIRHVHVVARHVLRSEGDAWRYNVKASGELYSELSEFDATWLVASELSIASDAALAALQLARMLVTHVANAVLAVEDFHD